MSGPPRTIAEILAAATARIAAAGVAADEARQSAWVLAGRASGLDRASLVARLRDRPPAGFETTFAALVARRAAREPVAYITGEREFYGRTFGVTRDVLIPRPETELVVEEAMSARRLRESLSGEADLPDNDSRSRLASASFLVVDVGTGSGCLAITIALECPSARVIATDSSRAALDVARANAGRLGIASRVDFRLGEYLAGVAGPIDLIVSNPPYVTEAERRTLDPEVVDFEPGAALFAGADGLDAIRALIPAAAGALAPAGRLVMEIGHSQIDDVRRLLDASGLTVDRVRLDLQQIPRVVVARAPGQRHRQPDV